MKAIDFVLENWEIILTIGFFVIGLIRQTAWGMRNKDALDLVVGVIESSKSKIVKMNVESKSKGLSVAGTINEAVRRVDPR